MYRTLLIWYNSRQLTINPCLIVKISKSKNVSRADDQQERLKDIGWIVGFVDGEGCFSINFVKQQNRKETTRMRKGYKIGYQIAHEFSVVQGEKSLECLEKLKTFFGVGNIYVNHRYDNHKEHLYRYTISKRSDLINRIIPFFEENKLKTSKKFDFELFTKCMTLIEKNEHTNPVGAIKIAQLCEQMNHKKPRTELIRILRNQTPNSNN